MNIAVLGAGVVGLTTALELQKQFHGANITIIADTFYKNTTSYVAAGLFCPEPYFSGPTESITRQWINDSYKYWDDIRAAGEKTETGVCELSGYGFSNLSPGAVRNHLIEKVVPIYRPATEEERKLCAGDWKYGSFFSTLLVECGIFLPWASSKFLSGGGKIIRQRVDALSHLAGLYDVIVNCTGMGAKFLCNDYKLNPIRGQLLKVHAPWIKTFFIGDNDTYTIPSYNAISLGGSHYFDNYNLNICKYEEVAIRERCEAMIPSLKTAKLLEQRVGLRPHRDPVRVEKEYATVYEGKMKIVHNYGHGGYGVTTSPGTAMHAVQLVREMLSGNSKI